MADAQWPALQDGYVFSEQPQNVDEQWLMEKYPETWAAGVRVVTTDTVMPNLADNGMTGVPGALVQYVGGERFEGTPQMPLGFRNWTDPNSFPQDSFEGLAEAYRAERGASATSFTMGQRAYTVSIAENMNGLRREPGKGTIDETNDTTLTFSQGMNQCGEERVFADWESAWAWVQANGLNPGGKDTRVLMPGEVGQVLVSDEIGPSPSNRVLLALNPATGQFETIRG